MWGSGLRGASGKSLHGAVVPVAEADCVRGSRELKGAAESVGVGVRLMSGAPRKPRSSDAASGLSLQIPLWSFERIWEGAGVRTSAGRNCPFDHSSCRSPPKSLSPWNCPFDHSSFPSPPKTYLSLECTRSDAILWRNGSFLCLVIIDVVCLFRPLLYPEKLFTLISTGMRLFS